MLHEEAHSKLGQRSPNKAAAQGQQRAQRGTAAPHVTNSAVMRSSGDAGGIEAQTSRASLRDSQTLRHSSIGNARSPQPLLSARSSAGGAAVHGSSRLSRPASVAGSHQAMPAAPRGAGRSSSASSAGRAISERASATQALVRRTTYEELLNVFKPDPRGGYKLKKVAAGVRVRRPSVAVRSRRTTAVAEAPEAAQQQQQPLEAADQQAHLDDNNASAAQASHQEQLEAWEMEAASKVVEVLEMTRQRASAVAYNAAEDAAAVAAVPPPAPLWPRRQRRQKSLARGLVYFWKFN